VMQGAVPVHDDDTADALAARVLAVEHRIYPKALELVASGRARFEGDLCKSTSNSASDQALIVPA
jgi:phosphoribosylglycinamide formyltransferase 1